MAKKGHLAVVARLKSTLESGAYVRAENETIVSRGSRQKRESGWLFDVRRILLKPDALEDIGNVFWETFGRKQKMQIGGIETAAIPLVTALVMQGAKQNIDVSGFFIRKSRKKDGLMRMVEGDLRDNVEIVLVDDLINSGKSLIRQVEVLEALGHSVTAIWTLIRFRDPEYYQYFHDKKIAMHSVFELNDFKKTLGIENLDRKEKSVRHDSFRIIWKFQSKDPSYQYVVPKSDPTIDAERVYVGSDAGVMWALNQQDGSVVWSKKIASHVKGKGIFSSPVVHNGFVYFGGYDGNTYALDAKTGKTKWVSFEADWVGSSPALAEDLGLVFIGLEYGLWRKRGGIAAIDMKTGKTVWAYREMPCYTHSSPRYIQEHRQVVIGSNDGAAYLFDAKTGSLVWKFESGTPSKAELESGFSAHDIKESFAYDVKRDLIVFGNGAGNLFFLDRLTGTSVGQFEAEFGFYSTPVLHNDTIFASSLDKNLYSISLDTFEEKWRWHAGARIFATPIVIEGSIYQGANTGRLTEINPETGKEVSFVTLTERITNRVAYNQATKRFFVPTFANELYCLEKADRH